MNENAIITLADSNYFEMLNELIDSIHKHPESKKISICVLDAGLTEEQIYKFLTNKYGDWILYNPQFNKNTYFLWFLPLLILSIGAIILKKLINLK